MLPIFLVLLFLSTCVGVAATLFGIRRHIGIRRRRSSQISRSGIQPDPVVANGGFNERPAPVSTLPLPRLAVLVLRFLWPLIELMAQAGRVLYSAFPDERQRRALARAGFEELFSPAHWLACRVLLSAFTATGVAVILVLNQSAINWIPVAAGLMAALLSTQWLQRRARDRRAQLLAHLPFCIDMLVICLESGLNLSAAIEQTVLQGPKGALTGELGKISMRQRSGQSLRESLQLLASQCALPQIDSLVSSVIAAQSSGSDLGQVLAALSQQIRDEIYFEAEQRAMRAPVKMLAPLLLFVFPCTFLILLFPIGMRLVNEGLLR